MRNCQACGAEINRFGFHAPQECIARLRDLLTEVDRVMQSDGTDASRIEQVQSLLRGYHFP